MTFRRIATWPLTAVQALRQVVGEYRFRNDLMARHPGLRLGKFVDIRSPDRLVLGRDAMIDTGVMLHCGGADWSNHQGGITIGDHCYIGPCSVFFGSGGIEAGHYLSVGPGVVVAAQQVTQYGTPVVANLPKFAPIKMGNNVSICAQATILQGVTIGDHVVIGAGALVTKDIPDHSLAVGAPARVVRRL